MRRTITAMIAGAAAILIFAGIRYFGQSPLSPEQQNTVKLFGDPAQFVVTYLPRDDGKQLVRSEIWYYPEIEKQFSFLGGKLAAAESFSDDSKLPPTDLNPWDFDFDQEYTDVADILGEKNIEKGDFLEGFYDEDLQTYLTEKAVFIIENGQLIYLSTVGVSDQPQPTPEPSEQ